MKTTLNTIRRHHPCNGGYKKLLKYLDKTKADGEELDLLTILESNDLSDTLWCLRAVKGYEKEKKLLAIAFARQVQHLMKDGRSIKALDVAERYINGVATEEETKDAVAAAASSASYAAAYAAAASSASYAAYAAYTAGFHDEQIKLFKEFLEKCK